MVQFYFNSAYPACEADMKSLFVDTFAKYAQMYQQRKQCIEPCIITNAMPSDIDLNGVSLSKAIYSIEDKDTLRFAIASFNKYPIEDYCSPDIWEEEGDTWDYTYQNLPAIELYFAHRMEWVSFSLPVSEHYQLDKLGLTHRSNPDDVCYVTNFYGDNAQSILQIIDQREGVFKRPIDVLLQDIFAGYKCEPSDEFVRSFEALPLGYQNLVNEKFRLAYSKGLIFPVVKVDKKHVERCRGKELEGLFELRVLSGMDPRVYFLVDNSVLYLGLVGTKAQSVDEEQTADMRRAKGIIDKLR